MGTICKKNSLITISILQETPSKPSVNLPPSSSSPQLLRIRISVNSWMVSTSLKREMLKLLMINKQKFTSSLTQCFMNFILLLRCLRIYIDLELAPAEFLNSSVWGSRFWHPLISAILLHNQ